jgi:hypothetical protein
VIGMGAARTRLFLRRKAEEIFFSLVLRAYA